MQALLVILKKKDLTIGTEKFHLPSDCCVTDFARFGGSEGQINWSERMTTSRHDARHQTRG
jgi:hypothetical protein